MIPNVDNHPDVVLEALLSKKNRADKNERLNKLHDLCKTEYSKYSQGARDLSLAHMSRLAESHGLFKARAIYNKQSEDYVALINAWATYGGAKKSAPPTKESHSKGKYDAMIERIADPAVKSFMRIKLAERDRLEAEVNLLKSQSKLTIDMRPVGANESHGRNNPEDESKVKLTDSERHALEHLVSNQTMVRHKWMIGEAGEVLDSNGRFVFQPGLVWAIHKILEKSSPESLILNIKDIQK